MIKKDIPGFPGYAITEDGRVFSRWRRIGLGRGRGVTKEIGSAERELKTPVGSQGYPVTSLGRCNSFKVATLVLLTFVGTRPEGHECRHLDGNKSNSSVNNLAWGSSKENTNDQRRHGTLIGGERHGMSKLTNRQVAEIKALAGTMPQWKIGKMFGVKQPTISEILAGKKRTESTHSGKGK